jgi:hypothetical protein
MGESVLVFVSHSSDDKEELIEPIVSDLEDSYINVWFDKKKIVPGDNLRKSIFKDGLDKADIALIFFTAQSLQSSWVDKEIKHVLREESKKGNNFDLNKIISIFDSKETYDEISNRYPELTDDLLHLMPKDYNKVQLGQLISAIWSKYLSLQGGDVETQRQLLSKEKEIFQKEKEIQELKTKLQDIKSKTSNSSVYEEYELFKKSGRIVQFTQSRDKLLADQWVETRTIQNVPEAVAFGLAEVKDNEYIELTPKGQDYFKWHLLEHG